MITKAKLTDIVYQVNGAAIEVHKQLGPGLLESVYHKCLRYEMLLRGIDFQSGTTIPNKYRDEYLDVDLRFDFFVENNLVVEIKACETILPIHKAQLLTYMKLLEAPIGLMINFNCENIFRQGQKTYVNDLFRWLE